MGSPLIAITAADMTNIDKVYVYQGSETGYTSGNWYYYNGTSWASGGVYNATAVSTDKTLTVENTAADAKAVGDALDSFIDISTTQPSDSDNRLWINPENSNAIEVPTQAEMVAFETQVESTVEGLSESFAPEFDDATAYSIGDYVVNNGVLYKFTSNHAAGVWNNSHVQTVTVMNEVESLSNDLDTLETTVGNIVDNTLSLSGKAADAKKTGDEISSIKDDMSVWGISGLVDFSELAAATNNGVTFTPLGKGINLNGTAGSSADAFYYLYRSDTTLPEGMEKEKDYYAIISGDLNDKTAFIQVYAYYSSSPHNILLAYPFNGLVKFTIPASAEGLWVRIGVTKSNSVNNKIVYPQVRFSKTIYELENTIDGTEKSIETVTDNYITSVFDINNNQIWDPFEVKHGGIYKSNGEYQKIANNSWFEFEVEEGHTYKFATPDPTESSGVKSGSAFYVCPVLADGSFYYTDANAQQWKSNYTVPENSGISKLIISIPDSRMYNGLYCISETSYTSANPYKPKYTPKGFSDKANKLKSLKRENGMIDIVHRGFISYPDNSMMGFWGAKNIGFDYVETDVQCTQDGYFVLIHDGNTQSVTGVSGNIADMTLAEIKELNLQTVSSLLPTDQKIPELHEALDFFHDNQIIPVFELKKETITTEKVHDFIDIVEHWGDDYIIISLCHQFQTLSGDYPLLLEEVRKISDEIIVGPVVYDDMNLGIINRIYGAYGKNTIVCMDYESIVDDKTDQQVDSYISQIHQWGMLAECGALKTKQSYERCVDLGFDYDCTNFALSNHNVEGVRSITPLGDQYGRGTGTEFTITLADAIPYRDMFRLRGIFQSDSPITISDNTGYDDYTFDATTSKAIDYQILQRAANPITITISSESTITFKKASYETIKMMW